MEFRQLLTVALFMFAAAIMKSTMSGQLLNNNELSSQSLASVEAQVDTKSYESPSIETLAAVPFELITRTKEMYKIVSPENKNAALEEVALIQPIPIPGSMIAIVVAALGLVSVARRTSA